MSNIKHKRFENNYKPPCKNGKTCKYFPYCDYYHTKINSPDCRNLDRCEHLGCIFKHPDGFIKVCKYGSKCKNTTCVFKHINISNPTTSKSDINSGATNSDTNLESKSDINSGAKASDL